MCATPLPKEERIIIKEQRRPFGPIIECRCGCGAKFHQFDKRGAVRTFAGPGHYNRGLKRKASAS